jgi:N-acetyltransferase 10
MAAQKKHGSKKSKENAPDGKAPVAEPPEVKKTHNQPQRKKVDPRVRTVLQNGIAQNHRSLFVIVGDRGRDQVVNLHLFLAKARISKRPSVLWCYKKELGFTSHRKKRIKLIKKQIERGTRDADKDDPFELFVSSTDIRYTYYKETHKILGNTYGMCVLQDFEALTPNLLARTVETVEGGGIIVLLLKTMTSLKQLYTMAMDVHSRYRTESHQDVTARFNERFLLSLAGCQSCLVVDDELNVLPISLSRNVVPAFEGTDLTSAAEDSVKNSPAAIELKELKESLKETQPVGCLVNCAVTRDQAKALLTFAEAISEKTLRSTVTLTASRGRGKSAALGLAMAAAIAYGYANIFVTSPSPENLKTLFEFVFKGLDALEYEEHLDYDLVQSTDPALNKAIVRVNVFRSHRQTIQYIHPEDAQVLGQAELLIIDEAAAIPLPIVQKLMGPYLIFMASTIHGYEGTGRSLSLKLIQSLREQQKVPNSASSEAMTSSRTLREVTLEQPIRYGENDPVEQWLNKLLCLDAMVSKTIVGCPHPSECQLYYVSRDTLFSHHPVSESFLQRMMALYVASHYKNTPNDLQLMSDAPAHHLFVLLPPQASYPARLQKDGETVLPEPLVVLQVCLEGQISKRSLMNALARGIRADGDLIPWCMSQQFQDDAFPQLSGARVVRIATHPDYVGMGYGSYALNALEQYYRGDFDLTTSSAVPNTETPKTPADSVLNDSILDEEISIRPADQLPPLLMRLSQRQPEPLDWLGVSFGITRSLFKFWKKSGFFPLYLRQTPNELTGEHTCIMLKSLSASDSENADHDWVKLFSKDFCRRFLSLLGYEFRKFPSVTCISLLEAASAPLSAAEADASGDPLTITQLEDIFSQHDLKRLDSYANHLLDYHVVLDLVPQVAQMYFVRRLGAIRNKSNAAVELSGLQQSLLLGLGLQRKSITELEKEYGLPSSQLMALFLKTIRKFNMYFMEIQGRAIENSLPQPPAAPTSDESKDGTDSVEPSLVRNIHDEEAWDPLKESLNDELSDAGDEQAAILRERQKELLSTIDLSEYSIGGNDEEWNRATKSLDSRGMGPSGRISVRSTATTRPAPAPSKEDQVAQGKKRGAHSAHSDRKSKKHHRG